MKNILESVLLKLADGRFNFFYFIIFVLVLGLISLILIKSEFMMVSNDHYVFGYDYRDCLQECRIKVVPNVDNNGTIYPYDRINLFGKERPYGFIRGDSNNSR